MAHSSIEEYLRPTILPNIWMDPWSKYSCSPVGSLEY